MSGRAGLSGSRVAVVGGGVAGITAACRLAERGARVTLLESHRRLGGATYSFVREGPDGGGAVEADNGQHVMLGCYTRYRALLRLLGSEDRLVLQDDLRIPVLVPGRAAVVLEAPALPAPAHAIAALMGFRALDLRERLGAVRGAAALARLDPADPAVDEQSFGGWLRRHGQGERAREEFWGLFCRAALNTEVDAASLALAAMIVRTAFLTGGREAARIGIPAGSLDELHVGPAARFLAGQGAEVALGAPVRGLAPAGAGWQVHWDSGGEGRDGGFDAVVLAVPADAASRLLPPGAVDDPGALAALGASPIVNVHLHLDRPVLEEGFVAVSRSPLSWIFDRTGQVRAGGGQYLSMPLSAAAEWVDLPAADIRRRVLSALADVLPRTREARVLDLFVTRERRATFRQSPGSAALRPPPRTGLPGLVLAGAWTATGWPDTIEGAVRSGEAAAGLVAEHLDGAADAPRSAPVPPARHTPTAAAVATAAATDLRDDTAVGAAHPPAPRAGVLTHRRSTTEGDPR